MEIKKNRSVDRNLSPAKHIITNTHTPVYKDNSAERTFLRALRRVERHLHHFPCSSQRSGTSGQRSAAHAVISSLSILSGGLLRALSWLSGLNLD